MPHVTHTTKRGDATTIPRSRGVLRVCTGYARLRERRIPQLHAPHTQLTLVGVFFSRPDSNTTLHLTPSGRGSKWRWTGRTGGHTSAVLAREPCTRCKAPARKSPAPFLTCSVARLSWTVREGVPLKLFTKILGDSEAEGTVLGKEHFVLEKRPRGGQETLNEQCQRNEASQETGCSNRQVYSVVCQKYRSKKSINNKASCLGSLQKSQVVLTSLGRARPPSTALGRPASRPRGRSC